MGRKSQPQAIYSRREDGYDVQFEEMRGLSFVCRACRFHPTGLDARMIGFKAAIKHLECHQEIGHQFDRTALVRLKDRL
jgi:hypothetical protein